MHLMRSNEAKRESLEASGIANAAKVAIATDIGTNMEAKDLREKLNGILEAIAAGHSCEQILAADHTLSYHDIFHAVAEAPTTYWDRPLPRNRKAGSSSRPSPVPTPVRQRTD